MILNLDNPLFTQLFRFALVGGTATLLHAVCGYLAVSYLGFGGMAANVIGFGCAWWVSFFGHHLFTFQSQEHPITTLLRFVVHSLAMFLIAAGITTIAMRVFSHIPESFMPVIGSMLVPIVSFLSSKYLVFRRFS